MPLLISSTMVEKTGGGDEGLGIEAVDAEVLGVKEL